MKPHWHAAVETAIRLWHEEAGSVLVSHVTVRDAALAGAEAVAKAAEAELRVRDLEVEALVQAVLTLVHNVPLSALTERSAAGLALVSRICTHMGYPIGGARALAAVKAGPIRLIPRPS